jgi:hypothetical protein
MIRKRWKTMIKRRAISFSVACLGMLLIATLLSGCITFVKKNGTDEPPPPVAQEEIIIKLERTACFGTCPVYSVTIDEEGTVIYEGVDHVQTKGTKVTTISADAVNQLISEFEKADYYSLNDSYTNFNVSDMPSANTLISIGDRTKAIKHYHGDRSAPEKLTELENKIDEIVNSAQWIK